MGYVNYESRNHIATITINREEALNALSEQVFYDLAKVLQLVDTTTIRCVIITGSGNKSFAAGADIAAMANLSRYKAEALSFRGNRILRNIETFPVPVIAAVNGYALGGGCELAMACDIRIASENAIFGMPEASLGITAGYGGTQRLTHLVPLGIAKELLYTCDKIDALKAKEIGLVNEVYSQAELMEKAVEMAEKIAANAPIAIRNTKRAIVEGHHLSMETGVALEAKLFGECFETADQKEGMKAFIEKRERAPYKNK